MKLSSIVVFSLSISGQANGQEQESAWRPLGTVNHPGHVIAVNENVSGNNLIFAFGGTGTEVEVARTGGDGPTITTETILAEQGGSNFGAGLATEGSRMVAIGAPSYVNGTVVSGAVLYIHSTLLKAVGQVSLNNEEVPSSVVTTPEGARRYRIRKCYCLPGKAI